MTWLLDTNVLIHAQRGEPARVRERLRGISPEDVSVSAMSVAELSYGAARSRAPEATQRAWGQFLDGFTVLPFDREAAELHGQLRHELRRQPIGDRDLVIACTALAHDLTLVTANLREFRRVPGLRVEDWSG